MVEGAKFAHGEGHFHIVKQDGDKLHVRNTATGEEHTITKQALAQKLAEHHAEGLKAYRDRATKALAEAKANKASPKQIAKLEERVKRAGGPGGAIKHEDAVLAEVPEYQRRAYKSDTASELRAKAASVRDMARRAQERNQGGSSSSIDSDRQSRLDAEKRRHAAEAAEYEANATFLERLADAKDKDAGKETTPKEAPKPAPENKSSAKPSTRVDRSYEAQRDASASKAEGKPIDHNALSKIWRSHADSTSWDRSAAKTERLYGLIKQEIARTKAKPDYHGKEDMLTSLRSDLLAVGAYRKAIGSKPSGQQGADEPRPSSSATTQTRQPPSGFRPLTRESASKVDVGATLTLFNPKIGVPAKVQYRGRIGDEAHVLIDGMGMNVPLEHLSV